MTTYVEVQSKINEKRMKEYENQIKEAEALAAQQQELATTETPVDLPVEAKD